MHTKIKKNKKEAIADYSKTLKINSNMLLLILTAVMSNE